MVFPKNTSNCIRSNLRTPWIVLFSTLGFTLLATWFVARYSFGQQRALFDRNTEMVRLQIAYRLETYVALLRSGAAYFCASDHVSKEEFHRFVDRLRINETYPGIQGLGYTAKISPEQSEASLREFRSSIGFDFRFHPDANPKTEFFTIVYLEPLDARNRQALGYDMYSEPIRREAMAAARDSGMPRASARVQLVQERVEQQKQPGFLIYVPVYEPVVDESVSEAMRRERLRGFVYGAFRAHDFFNAALQTNKFRNLQIQVFDGESSRDADLIFESLATHGKPHLNKVSIIEVAGHPWTIKFLGDAELGLAAPQVIVPAALGTGSILSFLLFAATMKLAKANAEAARSRQLFERIADTTPDVLYVHNLKTQQNVFINSEATQLLGYSREQIEAMGPSSLRELIHPDDRSAAETLLQRLSELPDGEVLNHDTQIRHANGGYRWIFSRNLVFSRAPDGSVLEILGLATDVTERRATEEALRAANKAKDEFLATLSHELRTPLTPVLAIISTLVQDERLSSEQREELGIARRNVELEARLIDDLLDLTRIVRGKLALNLEPVDFHEVVEHTAASVVELRDKSIDFGIEWTAKEGVVRGDRSRLTQLLWNLLKNAAKFTLSGNPVRLRAFNEGTGPDGRPWLVIEIKDQGVGIDPNILPRIFNAFEQGDLKITRRFGGLGLGLAISKAIVEMHGGRISAASDGPGRGARFTVHLPSIPKPESAKGTVRLAPGEGDSLSLNGRRLLLVEDHADTAEILSRRLRRSGYRVVHASSVEAGLSAVEQAAEKGEPFEFVLSDIGLPDGTGHDLMRTLSTTYGLRGVAFSGFGMESDVRQSEEAGFLRHLTKPVDFELLKRVLAETFEGAGRPPNPQCSLK